MPARRKRRIKTKNDKKNFKKKSLKTPNSFPPIDQNDDELVLSEEDLHLTANYSPANFSFLSSLDPHALTKIQKYVISVLSLFYCFA